MYDRFFFSTAMAISLARNPMEVRSVVPSFATEAKLGQPQLGRCRQSWASPPPGELSLVSLSHGRGALHPSVPEFVSEFVSPAAKAAGLDEHLGIAAVNRCATQKRCSQNDRSLGRNDGASLLDSHGVAQKLPGFAAVFVVEGVASGGADWAEHEVVAFGF